MLHKIFCETKTIAKKVRAAAETVGYFVENEQESYLGNWGEVQFRDKPCELNLFRPKQKKLFNANEWVKPPIGLLLSKLSKELNATLTHGDFCVVGCVCICVILDHTVQVEHNPVRFAFIQTRNGQLPFPNP